MGSSRFPRISFFIVHVLALATALMGEASAQEDAASYPSKPIRIIVGFAAGGGNDLVARIIGPKLSEALGQPVIIENRPGAAGQLAIVYAQSQPADGYTMVSRSDRTARDRHGDLFQSAVPSDQDARATHLAWLVLARHCRFNATRNQLVERPRRLRQSQPGQVELSFLLACVSRFRRSCSSSRSAFPDK